MDGVDFVLPGQPGDRPVAPQRLQRLFGLELGFVLLSRGGHFGVPQSLTPGPNFEGQFTAIRLTTISGEFVARNDDWQDEPKAAKIVAPIEVYELP